MSTNGSSGHRCSSTWRRCDPWVDCQAGLSESQARAGAAGGTWYKGRWHTAQSLGAIATTPMTPTTRTSPTRSLQSLSNRLRICSHNVGMLSTDAHDELMSWLQIKQHQYDVICIQETGWSGAHIREWTWYVVSSGHSTDRNSGVMVLIARRLLPSDRIRYAAIIPDRILHVKLEFSNHHVDVLNVYQHPLEYCGHRVRGSPST